MPLSSVATRRIRASTGLKPWAEAARLPSLHRYAMKLPLVCLLLGVAQASAQLELLGSLRHRTGCPDFGPHNDVGWLWVWQQQICRSSCSQGVWGSSREIGRSSPNRGFVTVSTIVLDFCGFAAIIKIGPWSRAVKAPLGRFGSCGRTAKMTTKPHRSSLGRAVLSGVGSLFVPAAPAPAQYAAIYHINIVSVVTRRWTVTASGASVLATRR